MDMLVKLYNLPIQNEFLAVLAEKGIEIRKPIGPERDYIAKWITEHFSDVWASEFRVSTGDLTFNCFIAKTKTELLGFGCYDATTLGFFGPTGVREDRRGEGIGKALLMACMLDMRAKGYGYAIIGSVGPAEFYAKTVGAVPIPDSDPGVYRDRLRG